MLKIIHSEKLCTQNLLDLSKFTDYFKEILQRTPLNNTQLISIDESVLLNNTIEFLQLFPELFQHKEKDIDKENTIYFDILSFINEQITPKFIHEIPKSIDWKSLIIGLGFTEYTYQSTFFDYPEKLKLIYQFLPIINSTILKEHKVFSNYTKNQHHILNNRGITKRDSIYQFDEYCAEYPFFLIECFYQVPNKYKGYSHIYFILSYDNMFKFLSNTTSFLIPANFLNHFRKSIELINQFEI